jgi:hypothetical protein
MLLIEKKAAERGSKLVALATRRLVISIIFTERTPSSSVARS